MPYRRGAPIDDETPFQSELDEQLENAALRLRFARWLRERGDWRAAGYFYMARQRKNPYKSTQTWEWWQDASSNPPEIRLPDELWLRLPGQPAAGYPRCKEWRSRREAEDALCLLLGEQ